MGRVSGEKELVGPRERVEDIFFGWDWVGWAWLIFNISWLGLRIWGA